MNKLGKISLFIFFLIVFSNFVTAVKPTTQVGTSEFGYEIKYPIGDGYSKQGENFSANFHVFNKTNDLPVTNETASCHIHVYNPKGNHIIDEDVLEFDHEYDFEVKIDGNNFTELGTYSYVFQCNSTDDLVGGFVAANWIVTENGLEPEDKSIPIIASLIFVTIVFFILTFLTDPEHVLRNLWFAMTLIMTSSILLVASVYAIREGLIYMVINRIFISVALLFTFAALLLFSKFFRRIWRVWRETKNPSHFNKGDSMWKDVK